MRSAPLARQPPGTPVDHHRSNSPAGGGAQAEPAAQPRRHAAHGDRLCHGDFHPNNVLGDLAQPLVIDWPGAARGAPAADACRSYLLLTLHAAALSEPYLDAYGRAGGVPRAPILAWLPYLAAAGLAEGVAGETERLLELARPT